MDAETTLRLKATACCNPNSSANVCGATSGGEKTFGKVEEVEEVEVCKSEVEEVEVCKSQGEEVEVCSPTGLRCPP